jgi:hypothetical protein
LPDDYPGQPASWACNLALRHPVEAIRPRIHLSKIPLVTGIISFDTSATFYHKLRRMTIKVFAGLKRRFIS